MKKKQPGRSNKKALPRGGGKKGSPLVQGTFDGMPAEDMLRALHELRANMEELERKNDDLRRACQEMEQSKLNLEAKIRERAAELEAVNEVLRKSEKKFRAVASCTADLVWEGDVRNNTLNWFGDVDGMLGYAPGEFPRTVSGHMDHVHPDDREELIAAVDRAIATGQNFHATYRIRCKDGTICYWQESGMPIEHEKKSAVCWVGSVTDVTSHMLEEKALRMRERNSTSLAESLKESNRALKILLEQREDDKQLMEQNILSNVQYLLQPHIRRLKKSSSQPDIQSFLHIIESNLNEIISPFANTLSARYEGLSRREIEIADLIRRGKRARDIAELCSLSVDTVNTHRKQIRRKLGLSGTKTNLRSALIALSKVRS